MKEIDSLALFRLSVLGPMVSCEQLRRGELQRMIRELAQREYAIPGSQRRRVGEKTIEAWYYAWRKQGIAGLAPKPRADRGSSKISPALQEAVLAAKRENPRRSVRQIQRLLIASGVVDSQGLSRSATHRLLQHNDMSRPAGSASLPGREAQLQCRVCRLDLVWRCDARPPLADPRATAQDLSGVLDR